MLDFEASASELHVQCENVKVIISYYIFRDIII